MVNHIDLLLISNDCETNSR